MINYEFKKNIVISIIFSLCIFALWKFGVLYSHSLYPVIKENRLHIFVDWAFLIKLGICHRAGFDIYFPSSCSDQVLNYGNIFLFIPYFKTLEKFYFFYFPIIISFIFIYSIVNLIKPKKFIEYFLLVLVVFAPSTLLVIERGNTDILIFITIMLLAYSKSPIFNFIVLCVASLAKYYPLALIVNFFIEKKRNIVQIILVLALFIILFFLLFHFTGESFQLFQHKMKIISPTWGNQFSIRGFALFLEKLNNLNYNLVLLVSYIVLVFFSAIFLRILKKSDFISKLNFLSLEERFFILGVNLTVAVYLISDNVHYREIFLILLLPFIIKFKNIFKIKIFEYLFYFILFRYIFAMFSNYFILFKKYFSLLYFKTTLDIILISFLTAICIIINFEILKKILKK